MGYLWVLRLLLFLIAFPLIHSQDVDSHLPPAAASPHFEHGPEETYRQALTHLGRLKPRRQTGNAKGLTRFLADLTQSFFLYKPPEILSQGGAINGAKISPPLHSAVELLRVAASEGNPNAIYTLADLNFFGNYSYPRNFTEAFRRYNQLAALNGNSSAQFMVGLFYSTGLGDAVKRDQAKALLYYTHAADQGNERAQMAMGYIHTVGIGASKNCYKAVSYYKSVADKAIQFIWSGPPGGHVLTKTTQRISDEEGGIYGDGASVSSAGQNARHGPPNSDANASPDDVLEYLDLQSRKGDLKATLTLGKMYYDGQKGLKPDYKLAKEYFLEVARMYWSKGGKVKSEVPQLVERVASRAAGYLGRMFLRGEGMEPSVEIARTWLKRGVSNGDALSQYYLGLMHLDGLGVTKDPKRAAEMFTVSADQGYSPAQVSLGAIFLDQGDPQTAAKYFDLAARVGSIEAFYYLAELSLSSLLGEESCDMANHYYKSVAEKAESIMSSFDEANAAISSGDVDLALLDYMIAAEQGFEVAQTNVAFLLDKQSRISRSTGVLSTFIPNISLASWFPKRFSLPITTNLAFLYWARSARQFNIDSLIKMGDYWLLGIGVDSDQDKAAACYQTAAETLQSAQALWNLGWMHENGIGGVDQDFHLAKRFYDQALEINKEAYLAVKLSLFKLRLRSRWNEWTRGGVKSIQDERTHRHQFSLQEWLATFLEADAALHGDHDDPLDDVAAPEDWDRANLGGLTDEELWEETIAGLIESAAIIGLAVALAILVIYRRQRGEQRRLAEERVQFGVEQEQDQNRRMQDGDVAHDGRAARGGDQRGDEEDRGLFPRQGDAEFMNWQVGGIGH